MPEIHKPVEFHPEKNSVTLTHPEDIPGGSLPAIPSKSHAHRLLLAAALSDGPTDLICPVTSKDIDATAACLTKMGAEVTRTKNGFRILPIDHKVKETSINVGESGSTLRFLLPVLGALSISAEIHMEGRLPDRPLSPLDGEMIRHGIFLSGRGENPLYISGELTPGTYTIDGRVSSQYITGLLFALPQLREDSLLVITEKLESRPYVDITLQVLQEFGITILEGTEGVTLPKLEGNIAALFRIPGNQTFHAPGSLCTVEGDWSNAAFFLAAGSLLRNPVTVTGCNLKSPQGDKKIAELLNMFGASISESEAASKTTDYSGSADTSGLTNVSDLTDSSDSTNGFGLTDLTVIGGNLHGIVIDAADIPDLVPILSVVAAFAEGTTVIRNIERLRIKESDRVATVLEMLEALGSDAAESAEDSPGIIEFLAAEPFPARTGVSCIRIIGKPSLPGGRVDSHNDHRIAMAAAIASLRTEGPVEILTPMAVTKSYPGFYQDLETILGW